MKDLETVNKHLEKIGKDVKSGDKEKNKELEVLQKIKNGLNQGKLISKINLNDKEKELIKHLNLLTAKSIIYVLNIKENENYHELLKLLPETTLPIDLKIIDLKIELECTELSPDELKELNLQSRIDVLIKTCYKILNLLTFYTIKGGEEARAWAVNEGFRVPETDFEEKFIRAEVINYKDLLKAKSWADARAKGLIRTEGKDYLVKDGDIIEFKI